MTVLALSPTAFAADTAGLFHPTSFTLSNGMRVILIENHRAPVVAHMIWFNVGAADDPIGQSGIAHFFEHLMFKGTEKVPPGEISRIIARQGGEDNAFTSYDFTAYFTKIAKDRLPLIMELEADRMQNLRLAENEVTTERSVVREERQQRVEVDPGQRLQEQIQVALLGGYAYGVPVIGWDAEIAKLDKTAADTFYAKWYHPGNATLVVSGDMTPDELKTMAEKYYGSIPVRDTPKRERPVPELPATQSRIELRDENVQQPTIQIAYLAPSYGNADEAADPYALQILVDIFGESATSHLYRELVLHQEIASSVGIYYNPVSLQQNMLQLYISPTPDKTVVEAEAALRAELAKLLTTGVTAEEVAQAKKRQLAQAVYARDSLMHPAYLFGMAVTTGQDIDDVEQWPARINAVTVEEVNAIAHKVFANTREVTGVLLPQTH